MRKLLKPEHIENLRNTARFERQSRGDVSLAMAIETLLDWYEAQATAPAAGKFTVESYEAVWIAEYGCMDGGANGYWEMTHSGVEFASETEAKAHLSAHPSKEVNPGAGNFGMTRVRKELRPVGGGDVIWINKMSSSVVGSQYPKGGA